MANEQEAATGEGVGELTLPPSLKQRLMTAYAGPHRHYHGLAHVEALLAGLRLQIQLAVHPALIDAAIWFHDAIYDTHRHDNEERSAVWAEGELAVLKWPASAVDQVAAMVRATQRHELIGGDRDTGLFLDLDLSVLAGTEAAYAAYSSGVRAEYAWVDADDYREGRVRVLQAFLMREAIYFTPELRDAWEDRARDNLAREVAVLQHGEA